MKNAPLTQELQDATIFLANCNLMAIDGAPHSSQNFPPSSTCPQQKLLCLKSLEQFFSMNQKHFDQEVVQEKNFSSGKFSRTVFTNITFINCIFHGVYFEGCTFQNCQFINCTWKYAHSTGSFFYNCHFSQNQLHFSHFKKCHSHNALHKDAITIGIESNFIQENLEQISA